MTTVPVSAIVLAGGFSARMGRDKASLPFGPETLLERVVRVALDVTPDVVLAARRGQALPAGLPAVYDAQEGFGPLAALADALPVMKGDVTLLLACDMPLLRPALIRRLVTLIGAADACVPVVDGHLLTTCSVLRTAPAAQAAAALVAGGERSLRALVARLDSRMVDPADLRDLDPDLTSFASCNTPEEYDRALAIAGFVVNDRRDPTV